MSTANGATRRRRRAVRTLAMSRRWRVRQCTIAARRLRVRAGISSLRPAMDDLVSRLCGPEGVRRSVLHAQEVDMTAATHAELTGAWRDIAGSLFRLGATSYGGPAIMGVMQAELQEKRKWVSKERFLEGLSVANMLPGATATQLGIFLGYARGGWWGGLIGGLCFVAPASFIMLALTIAYATLGVTPIARGALYGLGPVVIGLFAVAVFRLGRSAMSTVPEAVIGVVAAAASTWTPLGIVAILVLAGCAGLVLFQPEPGALVLVLSSALFLAVLSTAWWLNMSAPGSAVSGRIPNPNSLLDIGAYFLKVGAFTIGGGLTMIA